ncbi:hypothetical protein ES319_A10G261100v1 [Gossypium barbadense]|uniref:Uncharacterized protein n=2 Tax=Gossypium TaxID=3633 RepID=A0A5J5U7Y4_GOSBA|nr:hypothetical protein ES319_A10G261100v1 [Gossypium barbadense]TYH00612.1 hypothetical protein ES288_A10G292600v1 [Gossypium darwinii]
MNLNFHPQRTIESPFETQGVVMPMFVICMLVYSITFCTPYFPEVMDHINLLAGSLATVLLTFTLFPPLGWLILFIWTIHFVKIIYRANRNVRQQWHAIPSAFDLFSQYSNGSTVNNNCHASLAFAIGVLLLLMPLKYPQSTKPLETYNAIMSIFIIVTLVYAAAWEIEHHLQTSNNNSSIHRIIVTKISLFSGSLATVVLVLLIVPEIGWFILLVWTLTLMKQIYEACQMLHRLYQSLSLVSYVFNEVFGPRRHFSQGRNGLV